MHCATRAPWMVRTFALMYLQSMQSSLSIVHALHTSEAGIGDLSSEESVRSLLRERDELALHILRTQQDIEDVELDSSACVQQMQSLWVVDRLIRSCSASSYGGTR